MRRCVRRRTQDTEAYHQQLLAEQQAEEAAAVAEESRAGAPAGFHWSDESKVGVQCDNCGTKLKTAGRSGTHSGCNSPTRLR